VTKLFAAIVGRFGDTTAPLFRNIYKGDKRLQAAAATASITFRIGVEKNTSCRRPLQPLWKFDTIPVLLAGGGGKSGVNTWLQ
jgi:hypothetical protein